MLCCLSVAWETPARSPEGPTVSSQAGHIPVEVQMLENLPGSIQELKEERTCSIQRPQVDQYEDSIPGQTDGTIQFHSDSSLLPLGSSSGYKAGTISGVFHSWPTFFTILHIVSIFLLKGVSGRKVTA